MIIDITEEKLTGKIYNRWKIIKYSYKKGYLKYFLCQCLDCGNMKNVYIGNILCGASKSCGCKSHKYTAYNINKKYNNYVIKDNIVYVDLDNNPDTVMSCDVDDWMNYKERYWRMSPYGYAISTYNYGIQAFHRIIFKLEDPKQQIDHINGNKIDNRRTNLRVCSNQENSFNKEKNSNNTSGYKGVYFDKEANKWRGAIQYNGKSIKSAKRYKTPEEAAQWYINKSNELFGEYSVYKSRNNTDDLSIGEIESK